MQINEELIQKFIDSINWDRAKDEVFSTEDDYVIESAYDRDLFFHDSGVTKIVLIPRDENEQFVIKVPFHDYWSFSPYYDDEEEEERDGYSEMHNAEDPITGICSWDYCHREESLYKIATSQGIGQCFPQTQLWGDQPYPIYLQERCTEVFATKRKDRATSTFDDYENIKYQFDPRTQMFARLLSFDTRWIVDFVDHYSIEILKKFLSFLLNYNIVDLHSGNYGYSAIDGRPVIIDFAGFSEDDD